MCRELGYDQGLALCCSPFGATFVSFQMASVQCHGNESKIDDCEHSIEYRELRSCSYRNYASVVCFNNNDTRSTVLGISVVKEMILTVMYI